MEQVLKLIKERNSYLRKFYTINKAELFRLNEGDFTRLEFFYKNRENLLEMVAHIERLIDQGIKATPVAQAIKPEMKTSMKEELDFKDQIITEILRQDVDILAIIESTKNQIIKELHGVSKTKQAVSSYHSESITRKK
ncbi:MAG: hypothetical protein AB7F59_00065 [Bdellovibrionales bacterium]